MRTHSLPGADLVERGITDLGTGVESIASLLVSIGAPRLRVLGCAVPAALPNAELRLYRLLQVTHGDGAHSQFNALMRHLVSHERARAQLQGAANGA